MVAIHAGCMHVRRRVHLEPTILYGGHACRLYVCVASSCLPLALASLASSSLYGQLDKEQ